MDITTGSESARERDLYKYYQPWLDVSTLQSVPVEVPEDSDKTSHHAQSSRDKNLTALAQLAALRLNVKRCLISLIDSNTQIILAEATKSLSLVDDQRHAPDDHLWLGRISLPRKDCVDEHVFGSTYTAKDADGREHSAEALVIPDLRLDERFKERPYVTADRGVKFYAGVPIVTKAGHRIGAYAVSDPQTRPGLSVDELMFMQDASKTITEHLENIKSSYDRDRGERMVTGLASFIEGLSDLKNQGKQKHSEDVASKDNNESDVEATDPQDSSKHRHHRRRPGSGLGHRSEVATRATSDVKHPSQDQQPAHYTETSAEVPLDTGSTETDVHQIFSRAAKIIVTATKSDGCVFFDASSGAFADDVLEVNDTASVNSENFTSDTDTDGTEYSHSQGRKGMFSTPLSHHRSRSDTSQPEISNVSLRPAQVLGAAVKSSQFGDLQKYELSENDLKRCMRRYPYGKIFYLDEHGHMSSGEEAGGEIITGGGLPSENFRSSPDNKRKHHRLHHLPQQFLNLVPGVRSVIFLPLFNYSHNRWFSGGFIWSTNGAVTNPEEEMPYLKTFGSTIMSEVASMEALNTNRAKTTFIASISHELRSPLHGILGSLEFLEDTMITAYQMSLIGSIETCGKTLLDTIDHLLDYAKINHLTQNNDRSSRRHYRSSRRGSADIAGISTSLTAEFDLACLAEEVVEAVFAGQTFRKSRLREGHNQARDVADHIRDLNLDDSLSAEQVIHSGSAKFSGKVFVILEINKAESWWIRSQPGALRRIIMNVFGNAIKYCNRGVIEAIINLTARGKSGHHIEITIKDTGKGMSKDYLQNQLFRAFSQEDSFSYGTGLGLSITKQIVDNFNGKIKVRSQKDVGTHVRVSLPLSTIAPQTVNSDAELMTAALRCTRGKTICLLSPNAVNAELSETQLSRLSESMAKTCKEWFEIDFLEGKTMDVDADIFFYAEPPPIEHLLAYHAERKIKGKTGRDVVLLIICTNAFEAASLRSGGVAHLTSLGRVVEVMSQPVGPRKLAKVLLQSLRQVDHLESNSTPTISIPSEGKRLAFETAETKERAAETPWSESTTVYDSHLKQHRPSIDTFKWRSDPNFTVKTASEKAQDHQGLEYGNIKAGILPGDLPYEPPPSPGNTSSPATTSTTTKRPSPLQQVQTQSGIPLQDKIQDPPLPRVLLVDDNAINLKLLVTFMKKIKLPYEEATNGLEAYETFQHSFSTASSRFRFILMDLQMPVMDGLESTRKIREFERANGVNGKQDESCIIAITGLGSATVQKEAFESGMSQFLTKPVKFKALQALLERDGGAVGSGGPAVSGKSDVDIGKVVKDTVDLP